MRIEQMGNQITVKGTPEEILEHIAALTHSVRNVVSGSSREASSSRPASVLHGEQWCPGTLRTVIEVQQ